MPRIRGGGKEDGGGGGGHWEMEKEQSRAGLLLLIVILSVPGFPPCAASHSFFIPLGSSDLESFGQYNDDTLSFVLVNCFFGRVSNCSPGTV